MSISELGALGEFFGAIAVVVTLVYVALQIRQNTDALKLGTAHNTTTDLADINLLAAENSEFAEIFFRGLQDIETLEGRERLSFYSYFHKCCRSHENVHYQFTHNALEAELFEGITKQFISLMSMPGARVYWLDRKFWYNETFRAFVDQQLARPDRDALTLAGT